MSNVLKAEKQQQVRALGRVFRYSWAELLQRVFLIDVLTCDRCGGRRKLLAAITAPKTVRSILAHLGLANEPPVVAPARAPPRDLFA